jgi:DNA-dependent RNA polymerase auxiliary subunit epsilon
MEVFEMSNEIVLLIGLDELPVGKRMANLPYLEVESEKKVRATFSDTTFNHWLVNHLGVNFVFVHPGEVDIRSFEICKKVVRTIHAWAKGDG